MKITDAITGYHTHIMTDSAEEYIRFNSGVWLQPTSLKSWMYVLPEDQDVLEKAYQDYTLEKTNLIHV